MILIKDIKSIILKYLFQCSTCKLIFENVWYCDWCNKSMCICQKWYYHDICSRCIYYECYYGY